MKGIALLSASALFLASLAAPRPATAQTPGANARGTYKFILEDELIKSVEFSASTDDRGKTTGSLTFTDEAAIPDVDDPEDPRAGDAPRGFYLKADLDTLTVDKNRALMGGFVRDSDHVTYIGKWVQLVVEDNGLDTRIPDRVVWTFCNSPSQGWVPSDAELTNDNGAFLHWWATDAERKGDVGIPSVDLLGKNTSCPVYPVWLYDFADLLKWDGDIVVQAPR
jgi:hypothetical protein